MGDTIKETFTGSWKEITGLTTGVTYSFQNVNTADLFLQQVPAQPDAVEIGKRLVPSKSATIIKESTAVWVRSKTSKGIAFYNALA